MSFTKFMGKDEISMKFDFSEEGFLERVNIEVNDKEFINKFNKEDKQLLDRVTSALFHQIMQVLVKPTQNQVNQQKQKVDTITQEKILNAIETKECPRCKTKMIVDTNCCQGLKEQGYAGVLKCSKCGHKIALSKEQMEKINAN